MGKTGHAARTLHSRVRYSASVYRAPLQELRERLASWPEGLVVFGGIGEGQTGSFADATHRVLSVRLDELTSALWVEVEFLPPGISPVRDELVAGLRAALAWGTLELAPRIDADGHFLSFDFVRVGRG